MKRITVSLWSLAVVIGLDAPIPLRADSAPREVSFTLLSYNVRGLPMGLSFPGERFPTIGYLASQYDVVLTQEMFGGAAKLAGQMPDKQAIEGMGLRGDPGKIVLKVLALPFTFFIPDFWPPFGSGLYTFVDRRLIPNGELTEPADIERAVYRDCDGIIHSGSDCFARKGFLRVRVRTQSGVEIDVYNTHLDSGRDSQATRWTQLRELACAIDALGTSRPVIVAGDLNSGYARDGDRQVIQDFREHLGLVDSGAGPENPYWRERDYILYRAGDGTQLIVDQYGEAPGFTRDGYALSDHPAIFARLHVEPHPLGGRKESSPAPRFKCDSKGTELGS